MTRGAYRNKQVLVTGGLGFIGSSLAIALVEAGAEVTVIDALIPQHGGNHYNVESVRSKLRVEVADMRNAEALTRSCSARIHLHLAGQVSHGDSMRDPSWTCRQLRGDDSVVEAVATTTRERCCEHLDPQVYGRPQRLPVDEDHPVDPVDVNGINKLAAEYYHLLYQKVYELRSVVLRLTNTYGPRQQITNERQGMAGVFLCRALRGQDLKLFGTGLQLRDFNYIDDVVDALLRAAITESCYGKLFNLGADKAHSLVDFCEILKKLCGTTYETVPFPADKRLIDIGDYYGSYARFNQATGWKPQVDLPEGIERASSSSARPGNYAI